MTKEFLSSIVTDELVFLFGSGISGALTESSAGWYKWLKEGTEAINDEEALHHLNLAQTADELIQCAGEIIHKARETEKYDLWMNHSIESAQIKNHNLAASLKKLSSSQCVFATTNYDSLIEQATGLKTISYSTPGDAFAMLDTRRNDAVLHIHGVYNYKEGIDDIIADEEQYAAIINNEGAQFIQHILGTRTLIMVGCGNTTDDVNIARFLAFAREHLKIDKTYYYLCLDNQLPDLPENIMPVIYGKNYSDLQPFLERMAIERLKHQADKYKIVGRTPYERIKPSSGLLSYHYSEQLLKFQGRHMELEQLSAFVSSSEESFLWWSITGQAGSGKSRLALELLKGLPSCWFGFFVNDRPESASDFIPFADTVVVIDYVSGRERWTCETIKSFEKLFSKTSYKLRILLLERDDNRKSGSWYAILKQRFTRQELQWFERGEYLSESLCLGDLENSAIEALIGDVCLLQGIDNNPGRNSELREIYARKFENLKYRPLFIQLFVEAWIENGQTLPRYDMFSDVLKTVVEKEEKRWLQLFDENYLVCSSLIRILVRACVAEINLEEVPELYKDDWGRVETYIKEKTLPGKTRLETIESIIGDVCQSNSSGIMAISPLYPDVIKEFIFSYYMDDETITNVMKELWKNCASEFSRFIQRCMTDFPEDENYSKALKTYGTITFDDIEVLQGRLSTIEKKIVTPQDDPVVLFNMIGYEYDFWMNIIVPNDGSEASEIIATYKMAGLVRVAEKYGAWSVDDMSIMMSVLYEAIAVTGGKVIDFMKHFLITEEIKKLSMANFINEANELREAIDNLIDDQEVKEYANVARMNDLQVEMMGKIQMCQFDDALETLIKTDEQCNFANELAVQCLMHSCMDVAMILWQHDDDKYINTALLYANKIVVLYPENVLIKAFYLICQIQKLNREYFLLSALNAYELEEKLETLKAAIDVLGYSNATDDPDGVVILAWASYKTLQLNIFDDSHEKLLEAISEADAAIKTRPDVVEPIVYKVNCIGILHSNILKDKVPHEEIESCFRYVEKFADSAVLREAFFKLLDISVDAGNRKNYMTKPVIDAAVTDYYMNPMFDSGIPEIETAFGSYEVPEPYVRKFRKVGANEPCPCGSGKKFKKCCRGKGIYD